MTRSPVCCGCWVLQLMSHACHARAMSVFLNLRGGVCIRSRRGLRKIHVHVFCYVSTTRGSKVPQKSPMFPCKWEKVIEHRLTLHPPTRTSSFAVKPPNLHTCSPWVTDRERAWWFSYRKFEFEREKKCSREISKLNAFFGIFSLHLYEFGLFP